MLYRRVSVRETAVSAFEPRPRSRIVAMKKIARSLRRHRELMLNYLRAQISSVVVEGLKKQGQSHHGKIRRFSRLPSPRIGHSLGKLPEPGINPRFLL